MALEQSTPHADSPQLITAWAHSVIQSAKQRMFDGTAYLLAVSGLPWYRQEGDAWIDRSWWVETAQARYERYKNCPDRLVIGELEILVRHCLSTYRDDARQRIEQWYEQSAHDPESWWNLATLVYPNHAIFEDLRECPNDYYEQAILAYMGYEDVISNLRTDLLLAWEDQDWFWVSEILSCMAGMGGISLVNSIASDGELQQIQQAFRVLANQHFADESSCSEQQVSEAIGQGYCIRAAIKLGWQDVIDALSENQSYINKLDAYDILWWSLTDKRQVVERLILQISPPIHQRSTRIKVGQFISESMALAIAWIRATCPMH